ncbi:MAG: hypothetical protein LBD92_06220 [Oscillospiraceae bacterium]|jgi:hypothetical protein|nr:hypothetical protein [Oscillospiraceae bacterium]
MIRIADMLRAVRSVGLEDALASGALSHAYIIHAESGGGETVSALAAAMVCAGAGSRPCGQCAHCRKALSGAHPDIIYVDKPDDKKEIPVRSIREIVKDAAVLPNEADRKVYIIRNASELSVSGQNALLKVLEEPPKHVSFIIAADDQSRLLPTVRSRCVELRSAPGGGDDVSGSGDGAPGGAADLVMEFFDAMDSDALAFVRFTFSLQNQDRAVLAEFIDGARAAASARLRDEALGAKPRRADMWRALRALEFARDYLQANVSAGHIAGMLCAELLPASGR